MSLTEKQKRHLRALAHSRKPVVIIGGAGVTEPVLAELDVALAHHELIKVRVNAADRASRTGMVEILAERSRSVLVQCIGHVAVLYRPAQPPQIRLP